MNPRVVIDRLDLDLRGVDPAVAHEAVRRLGPALQTALATDPRNAPPETAAGPASAPQQLAARLAGRIARRLREG